MARFRSLGDGPHRAELCARIIFGDPDDDARQDQADQRGIEQIPAGEGFERGSAFLGNLPCIDIGEVGAAADLRGHIAERILHDEPDERHGQDGGDEEALVHRAHHIGAAAQTDEIGADDGGDDTRPADQQRQRHQRQQQRAGGGKQQRGQHHRRADGHHIGLEQIGGHAGAIADIVAHIVGDDGGVAGIVFGNARFHLADQIGTDIGGLGEDAAAQTREDRDQRGAEGQRHQRVDHDAVIGSQTHRPDQNVEEHRDGQQREARDQHAGDRTCAERQRQTLLQATHRGGGGAHVGADRDVHADEPGDARKDRADQETGGGNRCAALGHVEEQIDQHGHDHADDADGGILPLQIGLRALLNGGGDFLHLCIARRRAKHLAAGDETIENGKQAKTDRDNYEFQQTSPVLPPLPLCGRRRCRYDLCGPQ